MNEVLDAVEPCVTTAMNESLLLPYTPKEVAIALKQMHQYKSPGPDASKSIANRIKPFLNSPIPPSQSAFVPGRLIIDNVLIAYELNHFLAHKHWGKVGHVSLKLDVSKAYDTLDWFFLESVLSRIGFHHKVVSLIMLCVKSVTYSFLFNGAQFGYMKLGRSPGQEDPLSPYLYLFYAEAFSKLICRMQDAGKLQGIAVFRQAPRITHLLFADDTLIFCQATRRLVFVSKMC
ncbi:UNVERIFIED_CONTAM: putative mitochondrial protein [Sesamum latifolium]|uniref:Mitochondrial protein n=1 Tax=Sesamum latifolium TaxID=2727402 RepID=A0AAW2XY36_9LAMI